jgi:hypothetical protein
MPAVKDRKPPNDAAASPAKGARGGHRTPLDATQREMQRRIKRAVDLGTKAYIRERRQRIEPFIDRHFGFKGAWELNRIGIGQDLWRAPANLIWAPFRYFTKAGASLAGKVGLERVARLGESLPMGLHTDVERHLQWLIYSELLELPYRDEERGHEAKANALVDAIVSQEPLREAWHQALRELGDISTDPERQRALGEQLAPLLDDRKDVAELTTSIITVASGLALNKSVNLGALGLGQATAVAISHSLAVSGFIFGPTLGGLFYTALPWLAAPSAALVAGVTAGVAALMGVLAAVAGVIADPAQRALGLHKRKLNGLLDVFEKSLLGQSPEALSFRSGMAARLFDVLDVVYTLGKKALA